MRQQGDKIYVKNFEWKLNDKHMDCCAALRLSQSITDMQQ